MTLNLTIKVAASDVTSFITPVPEKEAAQKLLEELNMEAVIA